MRVQSLRALQPNKVKYGSPNWYLLTTNNSHTAKAYLAGTGNATITAGSNIVNLATYVPHATFEANRAIRVNGEINFIDSITANTFVCRNNFTTSFTGVWDYVTISNNYDQTNGTKSVQRVSAANDPHWLQEADGKYALQYVATSVSAYKQLFFTTTTDNYWYTGTHLSFICTFKLVGSALGGNSPERAIYIVRNPNEGLLVDGSGNLKLTLAGNTFDLGAVTVGVKYTVGFLRVQTGQANNRVVCVNTSGQLVTLNSTGTAALTNDFIYVGACLYDIAGARRRPLNGYIYNIAVNKSVLTDLEFFQIVKHMKLKGTL